MRIETIAKDTVSFLSPYLTELLSLERETLETPQQTPKQQAANKLWEEIRSSFNGKDFAQEIAQDFIDAPDDEIVQAIFRHQLSIFLKEDQNLYKELQQLLYIEYIEA